MSRRARFVAPGQPHHVTQRGNKRQEIFLSDAQRQAYIQILQYHLDRHHVRLLAWCLMNNHVHLIAIPSTGKSLGLALGQAHAHYALEWNRSQEHVGHMWQNRFFSCPLEGSHLWRAIRYVELNPVRAGMVHRAWDWTWSSATAHVSPQVRDILLDPEWKEWMIEARLGGWDFQDWRMALSGSPADGELACIRRATAVGEPLGSEAFLARMEALAGRKLRVLGKGRPNRVKSVAAVGAK